MKSVFPLFILALLLVSTHIHAQSLTYSISSVENTICVEATPDFTNTGSWDGGNVVIISPADVSIESADITNTTGSWTLFVNNSPFMGVNVNQAHSNNHITNFNYVEGVPFTLFCFTIDIPDGECAIASEQVRLQLTLDQLEDLGNPATAIDQGLHDAGLHHTAILSETTATNLITGKAFNGLTNGATISVSCTNLRAIELKIKNFLQGAYDTNTGLMDDHLRRVGLLPSSFSGSNITDLNVFDVTGNDAIVDWVSVELHPRSNLSDITTTRAALLQRDGDVVDVDGKKHLIFENLPAGDYHIVVKHRNHLGIMSNLTVTAY